MCGLVILDMASVDQGLCKALHGRHCPPLSNDHKVILENVEKGSLGNMSVDLLILHDFARFGYQYWMET